MLCTTFRCLPGPGGLLEQDSYMIWLLTLYLEAKAEREHKESKDAERENRAAKRR